MQMQIPAQVEDFNGTTIRAVHLEVGNHSSAGRSKLSCLALSLIFGSQNVQFVDALLCFQSTCRLSFADISPKIAICGRLRSLQGSSGLFQVVVFDQTTFSLATVFVRLFCNRKSVVKFHVAVAACKSHADSWHATIQPFLFSETEHLTQPVANATGAKFEVLRNAFADEKWFSHPLRRYSIRPRCFVLALFGILF